jgi:hypothetical protein
VKHCGPCHLAYYVRIAGIDHRREELVPWFHVMRRRKAALDEAS